MLKSELRAIENLMLSATYTKKQVLKSELRAIENLKKDKVFLN